MTIEKIRMYATSKWNLALTDYQAERLLNTYRSKPALDENICALLTQLGAW